MTALTDIHELPRGQPLTLDLSNHPNPTVSSAYSICRVVEKRLIDNGALAEDSDLYKNLINVRILGHLLSYGPSDVAIAEVARSIIFAENRDAHDGGGLAELGGYYDKFLLRIFRRFRGRTPQGSPHHLHHASSCATQEEVRAILEASPRNSTEAKIIALARDGYRCVVTGKLEQTYYEATTVRGEDQRPPIGGAPGVCGTECAHIFSESINWESSDDSQSDNTTYTANTLNIITRFGYEDVAKALQGSGVHSLQNVLTLSYDIHRNFDSLSLWFERTSASSNTYRVVATLPLWLLSAAEEVIFESHVPGAAVPNPLYLHLHASCCKVAHMSGASDYYDELERQLEDDPAPDTPAFASSLQARLEIISR